MSCKRSSWVVVVTVLTLFVLLTAGTAVAKGPGGGGETAANNLSVPAIVLPGTSFTGVTPGAGYAPSGTPLTGYEIDRTAYYYVQGVHTWQAECVVQPATTARAEWGDNLTGDAKLKAGSPIRVELGLFGVEMDAASGEYADVKMSGYTVVKLEPSLLDRLSAYGTKATADADGVFSATSSLLTPRVYDPNVTFSVQKVGGAYVVPEGTNPTGEINATGAIVYGYNLRVPTAGTYLITFVLPKVGDNQVDVTSADAGDVVSSATGADIVSLTITVGSGGGGGKKAVAARHLRHHHRHHVRIMHEVNH